jgi:adenosylcobinamide-phosphate synthase
MYNSALIIAAAFVLDLLIGDPVYRLHPVRCIGYVVRFLERQLRRLHLSGIIGGGLLVLLSLAATLSFSLGLSGVARRVGVWAVCLWHIYLTTSCIALRDLLHHARPVVDALRASDLARARSAVQRIVGRDAASLDAICVARAAVETVAENLVDSLLAPLFWYVVGALVLRDVAPATGALAALVGYRTINTLDAMVGYRSERYVTFGRAAARLDDVLNFIPARLSIFILPLGATLCGWDGLGALKVAWRDRNKHVSPNAGHPESCLAGALHIRLGGPVVYPHGTVEKPWLGRDENDVTATHIDACCRIVFVAGCLCLMIAIGGMAGSVA